RSRRVAARARDRSSHRRWRRRQTDARGGGREEPRRAPRRARGGQAGDRGRAEVTVLALDYGRARTGVAVSDPTGTIARPVGVVERAGSEQGLARLAELISVHEVDRIVVGLPLTPRGERGEQTRATEQLIETLAGGTDVPARAFDERFTTDLAQQVTADAADEARAAAHLLSS